MDRGGNSLADQGLGETVAPSSEVRGHVSQRSQQVLLSQLYGVTNYTLGLKPPFPIMWPIQVKLIGMYWSINNVYICINDITLHKPDDTSTLTSLLLQPVRLVNNVAQFEQGQIPLKRLLKLDLRINLIGMRYACSLNAAYESQLSLVERFICNCVFEARFL